MSRRYAGICTVAGCDDPAPRGKPCPAHQTYIEVWERITAPVDLGTVCVWAGCDRPRGVRSTYCEIHRVPRNVPPGTCWRPRCRRTATRVGLVGRGHWNRVCDEHFDADDLRSQPGAATKKERNDA